MITSFRNPLVKRIKKLHQKKYRQREGAFFVEGIRVVLTAIERGAPIETIVYSPELLTSEAALQALAGQAARGIELASVSADVFQSFSDRENPVGLGAIIGAQTASLEMLRPAKDSFFAALTDVSDPGNLGTIVRTMDGAGAAGLILVGQTTDPFHPTAVKASMGALFSVPLVEVASMEEVWAWAEKGGVQTVATSARAPQRYVDAPYRFPVLLLLGSEGEGLPADVLRRADVAVTIPMYGTSSSLNLAVAAGLLLYQLRQQLGWEHNR